MARPRKNAAEVQDILLTPDESAIIPVEEQPYPLPEGWKWVKGSSLLGPQESQKPTGDFFYYIDIDAIDNKQQKVTSPKEISVSKAPSRASRKVHEGDTIFSLVRPYLRNIAYIDFSLSNCIASTGLYICTPLRCTNSRFLYWLMTSEYVVMGLNKFMKGDNSPSIRKDDIENFPFPLPPLDDQQRIVDCIESLFAKLDEAREKAEAVLDGFESRKAAILHKAFTGELTAKWREIRGIKKEDNTAKIKNILSDIKYGTSEKSDYTYTGLPVIRIPNITGSSVDLEDLKFLKSSRSSDYDLVERNDILMIRSNGSRELVGKCALVDEAIVGKAYASFLIRLRPNPTINPKYLLGFLSSSLARNQLFAKAKSSAGINNINSKEICSVDIWLPDMEEQNEIVRILDSLLATEQQIKEVAENVLNQIDVMKKAILTKAFRGELTRHIHN